MKAVLGFCALVAAVTACPPVDKKLDLLNGCDKMSVKTEQSSSKITTNIGVGIDSSISGKGLPGDGILPKGGLGSSITGQGSGLDDSLWPSVCPKNWKVKKFHSQSDTIDCQGLWYLLLTTPTSIKGHKAIKTGLFSNSYPSTCNRLYIRDTTPESDADYNTMFTAIDSSFNMMTQRLENTYTLLTPAYGPKSPYAVFLAASPPYYDQPIQDVVPLEDKLLAQIPMKGNYKRKYIMAVIGGDENYKKYIVVALANKYDNLFFPEQNIVWVFGRSPIADSSIYANVYNDLKNSGISPYNLVSVDHSLDLTKIPTVSKDDLDCVITKSVKKSTSSTTSVSSADGTSSVSTSSTTVETSTSTVEIVPNAEYKIPYKFDKFAPFGDYPVLKSLSPELLGNIFYDTYYVNFATPCTFVDENGYAKPGIFHTPFPTVGLQITFDNTHQNPFSPNTPTKMVDRAINMITGEVQQTRSYISPAFSGPDSLAAFVVDSEGYYKNPTDGITPIEFEGLLPRGQIPEFYRLRYVMCVVGHQPDKYLILMIPNPCTNQFMSGNPSNLFYVLSKQKNLPSAVISDLNQDLLRVGCNPNQLTSIDQTSDVSGSLNFDDSFFQQPPTGSIMPMIPNMSMGSTNPNMPIGSTNPNMPMGSINPLSPNGPSIPRGLLPTSGLPSSRLLGSGSPNSGLPNSGLPGSGLTTSGLPPFCPPSWQIKKFNNQRDTLDIQGMWHLQMAQPTVVKKNVPMKTGLFNTCYPSCNNRLNIQDTTPEDSQDFNTVFSAIDSSFNLNTGCVDTTRMLLTPAMGSSYAIFHVATPPYYKQPITPLSPLDESLLTKFPLEGDFKRKYLVAIIGGDQGYKKYMVAVVFEQYPNSFFGNDGHSVWMFTRSRQPDWSVYENAMDDIIKSGLCPNYLVSIDHSIDLSKIPTLSKEDIEGTVKVTSVKSSSISKSVSSSVNGDSTMSTSSSSSTTTVEKTVSTVEITRDTNYKTPYEFGTYTPFGKYQILKNLKADMIRKALSGKYFAALGTPCTFAKKYDDSILPGIFQTSSPATGYEVMFDDLSMNEWGPKASPIMMIERALNMKTGKVQQTRSLVTMALGPDTPWPVLAVNTEGNLPSALDYIVPLDLEGLICPKPTGLYKLQYFLTIVGYKENVYVILMVANKCNNQFFPEDPSNVFLVLTKKRILTPEILQDINQDLLNCGCDPNLMISLDQTSEITENFVFEQSYFQITESQSSVNVSSTSECSSASMSSSSSSLSSSSSSSVSVKEESSSATNVEISA